MLPRLVLSLVCILCFACSSTSSTLDGGSDGRVADAATDSPVDGKPDASIIDAAHEDATDGGSDASMSDAASSALLIYDYGSQISRSTLIVLPTGEWTRGEQTCCPPNTIPSNGMLTTAELSALMTSVSAVAATGTE
jgi:hypothetical protein